MKHTFRQLIVFLGVGLMNTGVTLGVILGLMVFLHVHPLVANFLGYALGLMVSFTLNRKLTFKHQGGIRRSGLRFLSAAAIAYGLNVCAILMAEKGWGVNLYLSQVLGNIAYTGTFFVLCRWMVFQEPHHSKKHGDPINVRARAQTPKRWPDEEDIYAALKTLVVSALLLWLLDTRGFNPLDDHQFARTILQSLPFGAYFNQELGRFYPLVAQEYVIVSSLFGHEASVFYRLGILKLAVLGWVLSSAISTTGLKGGRAFLLWLSGLISFGVAGTLFRLHAGDLNATILLLGYITLIRQPADGANHSNTVRLGLGFLIAVLASLYKESVAVLLLLFTTSELLRLRLQKRWEEASKYLPVLGYAIVYLVLYKIWAGHPSDANYALTHRIDRTTVTLEFLLSDPLVFLISLPLLLTRILKYGRDWGRYQDFDSMLLVALGYTFIFILLGMYNQYYLLPGMAFAWVGIAGILSSAAESRGLSKSITTLIALILIENSPAIFSEVIFQRQVVVNHGNFIDFMKHWAPLHCGDHRRRCNLVLEGAQKGDLPEVFVSLDAFFNLVAPGRLEVTEDPSINSRNPLKSSWKRMTRLAHRGDFVLINPYRENSPVQATPSLKTVFDTGDHKAPPRWRLDQWIYHCGLTEPGVCRNNLTLHARRTGYLLLEKNRDTPPVREGAVLKDPQYTLDTDQIPGVYYRSTPVVLAIRIRNTGIEPWLPDAGSDNLVPVRLTYRWMNVSGHTVQEGNRTPLPEPILPGESLGTEITIIPPTEAGFYRLEVNLVQEGAQWFPTSFSLDVLVH